MFLGREGKNLNETELRRSRSKLSNIKEQNQNWSNIESVQCISVYILIRISAVAKLSKYYGNYVIFDGTDITYDGNNIIFDGDN